MTEDEIRKKLDNYYYFTDFEFALDLGFTPTCGTPISHQWQGKYRCLHCKSTGYISYNMVNDPMWWGNLHGNNCRKRN